MEDLVGPAAVIELRDARLGLHAYVVIDNTAAGPAIGGVRVAADVTRDEVRRLARVATWKSAVAGLAHGGAAAGIVADLRLPGMRKEPIVRAFARAVHELTSFIPAADLGSDAAAMAWIHDEIGRAVGLPRVLGGIPLDDIGAVAVGLVAAAEVAAPACSLTLERARVAVQGFGAVGQHSARLLAERGARVVAVSDATGAVVNGDGLDVAALIAYDHTHRGVCGFAGGGARAERDLVDVDCDLWIAATRPDVLGKEDVARLRARLVLPGTDLTVTEEAERALHERGVLCLPDFIAGAGGVIAAAVELRSGGEAEALAAIRERVAANTREVVARSARDRVRPRVAALAMAQARVDEAMRYCGGLTPPRSHHAHAAAPSPPTHSFADEPE